MANGYKLFFCSCLLAIALSEFLVTNANGQGVGINPSGNPPDNSAMLDVSSTTKGTLITRMTTAQRDAISSPAEGLQIFNTTTKCFETFVSGYWQSIWCSCPTPPPTAPSAGTNVLSQTQIIWNWNAVSGATGYKWGTTNIYNNATDNSTSTSYTQTGLTCNTSYTLYIWAYNLCGISQYTTLVQSTPVCVDACNNLTTMTDARDGQQYNIVAIGNQCWMAKNLNYDQTSFGNDWCYNSSTSNCTTYGRLYNWVAAMQNAASSNAVPSGVQGVCPSGWHLPSDAEWCILENSVETGTDPNCNLTSFRGVNTGAKMKVTSGNTPPWNGTNASGFAGLPGGFRYGDGTFAYQGSYASFWSSSEFSPGGSAWDRDLDSGSNSSYRTMDPEGVGFSVRCVKN